MQIHPGLKGGKLRGVKNKIGSVFIFWKELRFLLSCLRKLLLTKGFISRETSENDVIPLCIQDSSKL